MCNERLENKKDIKKRGSLMKMVKRNEERSKNVKREKKK
jgi:hypothetical protein